MALSNIFREPQREITESAVGLLIGAAVIGATAFADYRFAVWASPKDVFQGLVVGLLGGVLGAIILAVGLVITHEIGESICDSLERRGIQLRPRDRR